jgi:predicted lysophospholipase L1 biosynthesis ABC-type transport system permease subunit
MRVMQRDEGPQPRRRSLADLEAQITVAEGSRAQWQRMVEALTAANRPCRREQAMLRLAEQRLERLRRSKVLLSDPAGEIVKG